MDRLADQGLDQTPSSLTANYLESTPLDRDEIPPARLNIENKARSNLFPWNGQFSPQFVEALLGRYADHETKIIDPFCGSGTVLGEASRLGLAATGIEINPAAYILARTYSFCNVSPADRQNALDAVEARLKDILLNDCPIFMTPDTDPVGTYQQELISLHDKSTMAERKILEPLIILVDFFKGVDSQKLVRTWGKLRQVIEALPYNDNHIDVIHGDARFLDFHNQFDLVLTSPPYINVYNYHQQYRASAEALGWDLLEVARAEIGSNRKHRGNRFLTVTQYCLDITLALQSLWAATSKNARLIFVLGRESRVRGIQFLNGEIAARLAVESVGYGLLLRQERVFTNRFGQRIYEDILHFTKGPSLLAGSQERARKVAHFILQQALTHASEKSIQDDIVDAIEKVTIVSPSPRLATHTPSKDTTANDDLSDTASRKIKRHPRKRQVARG